MLKPVLEDAAIAKVGHDLKFDAIVLARHGVTLRGLETDTMIASYLLDATRSSHPLEELALEHVGYKALQRRRRLRPRRQGGSVRDDPARGGARLRGRAIRSVAAAVADAARICCSRNSSSRSTRSSSCRSCRCWSAIERAGVRIDGRRSAAQAAARRAGARRAGARIYERPARSSTSTRRRSCREILFDKLGLPTETMRRTTKTKAQSTAFEVLEELALAHELPRLILEWRSAAEAQGHVHRRAAAAGQPRDGPRPHVLQPGGRGDRAAEQQRSRTCRTSRSAPSSAARSARAFVAEPGHVLISADYSQIELRVLAHLSGDEALIDAFRRGEDIHDRTALKVFGANSGLGEHELRRRAKIINYALLYGKQAFTLAKDIGVSRRRRRSSSTRTSPASRRSARFIDGLLDDARARPAS